MTVTESGSNEVTVPEGHVAFSIDGVSMTAEKGTLIIRAAETAGIEIPRFCDHPGLDPVGARELRQTVRNLQVQGKTILLTTHYMFEADTLCQRIAVINKGAIVALDTPAGLKNYVQDLSVVDVEVFGIPPHVVDQIRTLAGVSTVSVENLATRQVLHVQSPLGAEAVAPVVHLLQSQGLRVGSVSAREPTLEDAYVRLVGGEA